MLAIFLKPTYNVIMKVELAGLHHSPVYGVGLVIDVIDQDNFTVLAKGKHWKYELIEYDNGSKAWWLNGKLHRTDGPAIERANGNKAWYLNDKRHRADGPAVEKANGNKEWWLNGKRHRTDGPAIEWANGTKFWYLNGKRLSEDEFKALTTA